jgi:hypothetical protein
MKKSKSTPASTLTLTGPSSRKKRSCSTLSTSTVSMERLILSACSTIAGYRGLRLHPDAPKLAQKAADSTSGSASHTAMLLWEAATSALALSVRAEMDRSISTLAAATLRSFALDLLANYQHFLGDCALFGGQLVPSQPGTKNPSEPPSETAKDG